MGSANAKNLIAARCAISVCDPSDEAQTRLIQLGGTTYTQLELVGSLRPDNPVLGLPQHLTSGHSHTRTIFLLNEQIVIEMGSFALSDKLVAHIKTGIIVAGEFRAGSLARLSLIKRAYRRRNLAPYWGAGRPLPRPRPKITHSFTQK
jgi:hypothetical protein